MWCITACWPLTPTSITLDQCQIDCVFFCNSENWFITEDWDTARAFTQMQNVTLLLEGHGRSVFWRTSHPRFVRLWINFYWEQRLLEICKRGVSVFVERGKCEVHDAFIHSATVQWGLYNYDTDIDIATIQCKGERSVAHPEENKDCHLLGGLRL